MKILVLFIAIFLYSFEIPNYFSSNFIQTIYSKNSKLIYKGQIYFHNNTTLWKYTYPQTKLILVKNSVMIYEPELFQVTIYKKKSLSIADILSKSIEIKPKLYKVKLNNLTIYFEYDKNLKEINYTDELDNLVNIKFVNPSNKEFNVSVFNLHIPHDVDYIYYK